MFAANVAAGSAHVVVAAHSEHLLDEATQALNSTLGTIVMLGFMMWSYGEGPATV